LVYGSRLPEKSLRKKQREGGGPNNLGYSPHGLRKKKKRATPIKDGSKKIQGHPARDVRKDAVGPPRGVREKTAGHTRPRESSGRPAGLVVKL